MAKIKLSLPTGVVEEKSLLNAFKADNNSYIIFDAENVGSMGLPIILVCKYDNDRVTKITDADEWTRVKGYLKEIISGVSKEYIGLPSSLNVDEVYYTQLTLPVASFDALKSSYIPQTEEKVDTSVGSVPENSSEVNPVAQIGEISNEPLRVSENLQTDSPLNNDMTAIANPILGDNKTLSQTTIQNDTLKADVIDGEVDNISAAMSENNIASSEAPSIMGLNQNPENLDLVSEVNVINEPVISSEENIGLDEKKTDQPAISDIVTTAENIPNNDAQNSNSSDYTADKEAFLAACANMFDALVSKFETKNRGNNN